MDTSVLDRLHTRRLYPPYGCEQHTSTMWHSSLVHAQVKIPVEALVKLRGRAAHSFYICSAPNKTINNLQYIGELSDFRIWVETFVHQVCLICSEIEEVEDLKVPGK